MLLYLVRFSLSRFCWTSVGVQDPTTTPNTQSVEEFKSSTPTMIFRTYRLERVQIENWKIRFVANGSCDSPETRNEGSNRGLLFSEIENFTPPSILTPIFGVDNFQLGSRVAQ